jgi:hypothetical protein
MLERSINGLSPEERLAARRRDIAPLVDDLIDWMKQERAKLSRHNEVAKAMGHLEQYPLSAISALAERAVAALVPKGVPDRGPF